MPETQLGLFEETYTPGPTCSGCGQVITGEVWELSDGPHCADCADSLGFVKCTNCNEIISLDESCNDPDGDVICDDCYCDRCARCEHCEETVWVSDICEVKTGHRKSEYWCESCVDSDGFRCDDCGDTYDCDMCHNTAYDTSICDDCRDSYYYCEGCGELYSDNDIHFRNDYAYCPDCAPNYGSDFEPLDFQGSGLWSEVGSPRCYGLEVETNSCDGYTDLEDASSWGAKDDCTVDGKEMFTAILSGDGGLDEIAKLARLADSARWEVGDNTGFHLHLDMRNETEEGLWAIAYAYTATQWLWLSFVHPSRSDGVYSHTTSWDCTDILGEKEHRAFRQWACYRDRYNWFNPLAYGQHRSFEIRAHHGTCKENDLINWVKAHTRFADWVSRIGLDGFRKIAEGKSLPVLFDIVAREAWGADDEALREFYAHKARTLHKIELEPTD